MNDSEIIALYHKRDESAITCTDEKYGKYLGTIAYNILYDTFESDECVNDTYFRAWRAMPPEVPNILSAFLGRITRNIALDRYSAKHASKRIPTELTVCLDELNDCVGENDTEMDSAAIGDCINSFLATLRKIDRIIFVKRYFYCASISEISKSLRISEGQIKTSLSRMRAKLKISLESEGLFR